MNSIDKTTLVWTKLTTECDPVKIKCKGPWKAERQSIPLSYNLADVVKTAMGSSRKNVREKQWEKTKEKYAKSEDSISGKKNCMIFTYIPLKN